MANQEQLALLSQGVKKWNEWRQTSSEPYLTLTEANLRGINFHAVDPVQDSIKEADLEGANLKGASLEGANFERANLEGANLEGANLKGANLKGANLKEANLKGANLEWAFLVETSLEGASLKGANLARAYFIDANLADADLVDVIFQETNLERVNLARARLLEDDYRKLTSDKSGLCEGIKNIYTARKVHVSYYFPPVINPRTISSPKNIGLILFDVPKRAQVGVSKIVSIRITKRLKDDFLKDLKHFRVDEEKIEKVRVSKFMKAELRGDAFKIDTISSEEQIIEEDDFTQWDWNILPLKGGTQKLIVIITIILRVENEMGVKTLPVLEKELKVKINRIYLTKVFLSKNWQWLVASAALPIAALIVTLLTA